MNLYEYGIMQEQSDIRAHVSLSGRMITIFRTIDMMALLVEKEYPEKYGYQTGVEYHTARGVLIPLDDIQPQYVLRSDIFPWSRWNHDKMGCKEKGNMAVACVKAAIIYNKFPLWVCCQVNDEREIDIQGTDIIISAKRKIQVKYDNGAYRKENGGTGNLYIQTHECNPLKIH